jgi:signal transduction histidine kinase
MSSVTGYTDFLLSESVGILGALQRKFLERIKISTERMNRLINELVRLTTAEMDGGKLLTTEGMDLYSVVEGAISESMDGLRQKDINLRVDVPERLPPINADEEAIKQVLVNMLENAREVTPESGEIALRASLQGGDHQQAYVLVQISDQGGGIPPEYVPRVFSRFGYADGKPIPGTGGKSSHLSVVKMLVENSGGRIWVDSQPEVGSTFSILLPVASEESLNSEPGGLPA